jgi:outer membrane immunogenic protein
MRVSVLLSTAAAAMLMVGSASAADLGARVAPAPVYTAAPVFNWSGANIGLHGGYLWGNADPSYYYPTPSFDLNSGFLGGQIGFSWQTGAFVFGAEADLSWTDANGAGYYYTNEGITADLNWFGTVRGKLGYAFDNVLLYGTGGLAFGGIEARNVEYSTTYGSADKTKLGWTLGAGVDYAFTPNWTLGLEYRHMDFGKVDFTSFAGPASVDVSADTVRLNLNYRF